MIIFGHNLIVRVVASGVMTFVNDDETEIAKRDVISPMRQQVKDLEKRNETRMRKKEWTRIHAQLPAR